MVADVLVVEVARQVEVGDPETADGGGSLAADDEGSDEEVNLIDEIGIEERPVDGRSTLDQKSGDSAISQVVEKSTDIDPTAVVGGKLHQLNPGRSETFAVIFCGFGGVDDDGHLGVGLNDDRVAGDSQFGVEDHPTPVIPGVETKTARQPGVVGKDGVDADEDGIVLLSQLKTTVPRSFAGDPLGVAGSCGDPTVERDRCFGGHPWLSGLRPAQPSPVEDPTTLGTDALVDLDAFGSEEVEPTRSDRIRVVHGYHHSSDAGCDDGLDARRRSTVMGARLQGDVDGAAAGTIRGLGERVHLSMGAAAASVVPLTNETTFRVDHRGADHGVGRRTAPPSSCKVEGVLHPVRVSRVDQTVSTGRASRLSGGRRLGFPSAACPVFSI